MNLVTRLLRGKSGQGAYSVGKKLQTAGRFDQALRAFTDAERWLREAYGPDHIWTAQAEVQRAWCLVHLGRTAEAVPILIRALEQERQLRGITERARMLEESLARARATAR
jgi:tetratricopeptide (TPR) repeat protein